MDILKRVSIKKNIMALYITTTLVTFGIVYYLLFSNWINTADELLSVIARDMNETIYKEFDGFMKLPQYINEVTENQIHNGKLEFANEKIRENFFVGLLKMHSNTPIYSISIGTEKGEYYGARKNKDNFIEIMKNNAETGGKSRYYEVTEDMTAGTLVAETGLFDPRTRPWYKAAKMEMKTSFSPLYKHFVMEDLALSVGTPIHDKQGVLIGVFATHITLSKMEKFLNEVVKSKGATAVIVDKNTGELVANSFGRANFTYDPNGNIVRTQIKDLKNQSVVQAYENYISNGKIENVKENGASSHTNVSEFKRTGVDMLLITSIPDSILTKDIERTIRLTIIYSVLIMLAISFLYLSFVDKMLKPMESLNTTAKKITDGDFTERARIFREDEIGRLARTFNMMTETINRLVKDLEIKVRERTTDLEKTNGVLEESRAQLKLILDSTIEGIFGIDTEGKCTFSNKSALNILGYDSQDEILGKDMHALIHHTKSDGTPFPGSECRIMQTFKNGKGITVDDEIFWRKDKTSFDVRYSSYPQYKNKALVGAVVTFIDNSEQKKNDEHIKYLTYHDPLTDIHNRLFFEEEIERIDKENVLPVSVIFGDLNGLKLTNDIFGHAAGDTMLKEAAFAFSSNSSKESGVVARIGGDEFVLISHSCDDKTAHKLMAEIKKTFAEKHSKEIIGSISLGASTKTSPKQAMSEIIEAAENNMYRDKTMNRKKNNKIMITKIINQLHERSLTEKRHSENVSALSKKIAREMNLPEAQVNRIAENGYFHDIGKIVLDDNLLNKHRNFSEEEYREMQQHSVAGYRILNLFDETIDLAEGVLNHHEHWDGTGYPKGIKGEEIPLSSRIISVAESFDAITNDYGDKSKTLQEAITEIKRFSGIKYDPAVVDAFIKAIK